MTTEISINGGVILDGHEYLDEEIATLTNEDVSDWGYAGDQTPEESNIVVNGKIFEGDNALPEALAYIRELKEAELAAYLQRLTPHAYKNPLN